MNSLGDKGKDEFVIGHVLRVEKVGEGLRGFFDTFFVLRGELNRAELRIDLRHHINALLVWTAPIAVVTNNVVVQIKRRCNVGQNPIEIA